MKPGWKDNALDAPSIRRALTVKVRTWLTSVRCLKEVAIRVGFSWKTLRQTDPMLVSQTTNPRVK